MLEDAVSDLKLVLLATGSEVQVAAQARLVLEDLGIGTRVVSMPSWFLFDRQDSTYRAEVLPMGVPTVSVEAGTTLGWAKYAQAHVGIDRFGASAPGPVLYEKFGFTPHHVAEVARGLVERMTGIMASRR